MKRTSSTTESIQSIPDYFGELVFSTTRMRESLPRDIYSKFVQALEKGEKISKEVADALAIAVKEWALSKGVTHYCHWFQPMTGLTAEKHDAFITLKSTEDHDTYVLDEFTGSQLIKGEPDASSFPHGGARSTFEARGYTIWDPASPFFIRETHSDRTLCIPSLFLSYDGQALDHKIPLLRSLEVLSRTATHFLNLLGESDIKSVAVTLGTEQEYFLIDRKLAQERPDLLLTGRTLLGAPSPRGQQFEDHYFGVIPARVHAFMVDVEQELYALGVPVKTRHNEVAPSQFELAPIFENAHIAVDHNLITMDVLKRVAEEHDLLCLLHEKPFAGINGSGKHCNWSLVTNKNENLLEPGKTPHENLRFLGVMLIVLKAVHDHADILRASIASPGNDHRLGGNEAPPALISVFLGEQLDIILKSMEKPENLEALNPAHITLGITRLPEAFKDTTDRNRTSPFAFTGNKFEFRAVGSSTNPAIALTVLNSAVAESFEHAFERLQELRASLQREEALVELIQELINQTEDIRFEGNNYSAEWHAEAQRRKLPILMSSVDAFKVLKNHQATAFLTKLGVLTPEELNARAEINIEQYNKTIILELTVLLELITTLVMPALEQQIIDTGKAHKYLRSETVIKAHAQRQQYLEQILEKLLKLTHELENSLAAIKLVHDEDARMDMLAQQALPLARTLRNQGDEAELIIADDIWPLPKYRELLFSFT